MARIKLQAGLIKLKINSLSSKFPAKFPIVILGLPTIGSDVNRKICQKTTYDDGVSGAFGIVVMSGDAGSDETEPFAD
jgi:hypothetical protein